MYVFQSIGQLLINLVTEIGKKRENVNDFILAWSVERVEQFRFYDRKENACTNHSASMNETEDKERQEA